MKNKIISIAISLMMSFGCLVLLSAGPYATFESDFTTIPKIFLWVSTAAGFLLAAFIVSIISGADGEHLQQERLDMGISGIIIFAGSLCLQGYFINYPATGWIDSFFVFFTMTFGGLLLAVYSFGTYMLRSQTRIPSGKIS